MSPIYIDDIVKEILISRVYDVAIETPLERAEKASLHAGCAVYYKREDLQLVHSFKIRGAYNKMARLNDTEKTSGVITASAGNHAQGVALSAKKLDISALIIMPRTTPSIKIDAVKSYGAAVELEGDSYSEAAEYCKKRITETGRTYIHPFDDPLVIAGQGTIGREIIEQLPKATHVFVPVGGGGLLAGVVSYIKALRPDIRVISVEPKDSSAMKKSIAKHERLVLPHVGIFADGVAVKQVGSRTYSIARDKVDDFITVTTDQLCAAIKIIFEDTRSIVEPAGALALAGIMQYNLTKDAHVVAICSGANITFERLQQVAERTLIGSGEEAMYAVTMPEQPGALQTFCTSVIQNHNISEFNYRINTHRNARVLVGITIRGDGDKRQLEQRMTDKEYEHVDLTASDLTKEHLRHMVGGSPRTDQELFYEVTFPERPAALTDFLAAIGSTWNISLFHYKSAASDNGKVLIGFEADNAHALETKLRSTEFEFVTVNGNTAIELFV